MCFSATASFVASGGLAVVGVATLNIAPRERKFLAIIPLAFAVQQALEGIQWLALNRGTICVSAGYGFLLFAFLFWPMSIPFFSYMLHPASRNRVKWFLWLGIGVAIVNAIVLIRGPLAISAISGRVVYGLGLGATFTWIIASLYVVALCGSLLASGDRGIRWFGLLILISAIVASVLFYQAWASVWCFFAAIISVLLYRYVQNDIHKTV